MVRILLVLVVGLGAMAATGWMLRPNAGGKSSEYKFMHCDQCKSELVYNPKLAGQKCPKCQPPVIGTLIPTYEKVGSGTGSPWRKFNIALFVEGVVLLWVVVHLLYAQRQPSAEVQYVTTCARCKQRMNYPERLCGRVGKCPRCYKLVEFP